MSSSRHRGADVVARRLADAGCRFAFGIPGGEVLTLMDALVGAGLRFVVVRHENSGGFMAEGTYHASGAPGVLLGTVGPGVANLVNVVANAQQDRIPLIVLTGCIDPGLTPTFSHQVFDHQAVLAPVCKASFRLEASAAGAIVDKALLIATTGRPGPVHIDVPIAVADSPAKLRRWQPMPAPTVASPDAVVEAHVALKSAKQPVAIVGNDVLHQGGAERVRAVLERLRLPVLTTYKAKGVVDETMPMALGAAGLSPKADELLLPYVSEADVVLLVGYDPIEMRAGWRDPFNPGAQVVELVPVFDTQFVHRSSLQLVGDVAENLERITDGIGAFEVDPSPLRAELKAAFAASGEQFNAITLTEALLGLPADARITIDTGAHRILASQKLLRRRPGLMHQSTGLCTMGCALPVAIGAALADPGRPTVALVGDGGFEMVIGELATARDLEVSLTVVVYDDRGLALIEKKQRARGLANVGVDFGGSEFTGTGYDLIAEGFGAKGVVVDSLRDFRTALVGALARTGVDVVACRLPRRGYDGAI
ncbi:MAG: thiamine pyrophosphate-binding protein [Myxococcota bacterium]